MRGGLEDVGVGDREIWGFGDMVIWGYVGIWGCGKWGLDYVGDGAVG